MAFGLENIPNPFAGVSPTESLTNLGHAFKDAVNSIAAPETAKQGIERKNAQDKYGYTFLQYPLDLAKGARHPYWMTFYINAQDLSRFEKTPSKGPAPLSTVDINARQTRTLAKNLPGGRNLGFGRKTHRTSSAIRLYMPDTLSWSFANAFRDASLSGLPFAGVAQALTSAPGMAESLVKSYQQGGVAGLLASLQSKEARGTAGQAFELIGKIPGVGEDLAVQFLGIAVNPQIDVVYQSPVLREFMFDFLFAPRNEKEAVAVSEIIKQFKFHAAPELLNNGSGIGRYFVPPSEFDIEFSVETMGKISTCVLQNITIDYAPSGAAFYGKDDRPVSTRLTLQFKELEFITKELISEKGY
jgi:hypothetical protein